MDPKYLKALRKAKGLSLRALAKKVGVSHSLLHLYETGARKPKDEIVEKILEALDAREATAIETPRESIDFPIINPLYRIEKGARKRELLQIESEVLELLHIYMEIEELVKIAKLPISKALDPNFFSKKYKVKDMEELEDIALVIRKKLYLGKDPIHNVTDFLEDIGIRVIYIDGLKDFWAMAFEIEGELPVIALKRGTAGDRGRFSLLHEFGHLLLDIDSTIDAELACNRFAGAFLFPAEEVRLQFGKKRKTIGIEELKLAKFKYGISMSAILHRLLDVGVISKSLYRKYRQDFSRKGWLVREPVELDKESPRKIKRLLLILEKEGVIDVRTRMEYEYRLFGIWGV